MALAAPTNYACFSPPTPEPGINKSEPQSSPRLALILRAKHVSPNTPTPPRRKLGADILNSAAELKPVAELSSRSHAELVLSSKISEVLIDVVSAPNAEAAAEKLDHWLTPIRSHGRIKLHAEAHVYDHCEGIIGYMPTNVTVRRRLWATVARVRRIFDVIAYSRKSSSHRSQYIKLVVVSYFWAHDCWCDMSISEIAQHDRSECVGTALESARLLINSHFVGTNEVREVFRDAISFRSDALAVSARVFISATDYATTSAQSAQSSSAWVEVRSWSPPPEGREGSHVCSGCASPSP